MWTHRPAPIELLRDRVVRGWRPLPSALAAGPTVTGFAACLEDGSCAELLEAAP